MQNKLLLSIKNVTKEYRSGNKVTQALKGVSLELFTGEIVGLLGANGAGKTTLSSIIATLHPATSGEVLYQGRSIYHDIARFRSMIGYCPQHPNLNAVLTVRQNLTYSGRYFGLTQQEAEIRCTTLMKRYKLEQYADSLPSTLSGGYKQRVMIARALMHEPKLVIFDEPTVGLDPHIRRQLWETIKELKKDDISILITTHYLDEAEVLADRICILDKGLVRLIDTAANLKIAYHKNNLEDVFVQLMEEDPT